MKILLTGASGFLGKIIQENLKKTFDVIRIGRQLTNDIQCDLSVQTPSLPLGIQAVIHAAGKAHSYPQTEAESKEFYDVNVTGTIHLLDALATSSLTHFVFISSVSVYGLEGGELIDEENPLLGKSPYAKSKIEAERLIEAYCKSKNIHFILLRLPLIVGKNPLGNLGKMINAIQRGRYVRIAKGNARKSMVLAIDVASLINLWISNSSPMSGFYNLTDGYHPTFFEMENAIKHNLDARFIPSVPASIGNVLGKIGDRFSAFPVNTGTIKKITGTFTFSDAKARYELGWQSRNVLNHIQ